MRRFRRRTHPLQRRLRVQMELRGKARQLRLRVFNYSVTEWSITVAATAPSGGADIDEVARFIRRTCATADIFHQGTMVCYSRPDGFGHCVCSGEDAIFASGIVMKGLISPVWRMTRPIPSRIAGLLWRVSTRSFYFRKELRKKRGARILLKSGHRDVFRNVGIGPSKTRLEQSLVPSA